jgi:3-dehydroquinate synthase
MLFFLGIFLLAEQANPAILKNPRDLMSNHGISAALAGIGLLIADVILPVPSSLIMIANGALFGVAAGSLLSMLGTMGAALVAFFAGRHGAPLLAWFVPFEERSRANHLLKEWGWLAILITRPFPILAETALIMAGASSMSWRHMILAALAGSFPIGLIYAITGANAVTLENAIPAYGMVFLVTGFFWMIGRRLRGAIFK